MLEIKRAAAILLAMVMAIGLVSCGDEGKGDGEVLIKPVESKSESGNLKLAEVSTGSIVRSFSTQDGKISYNEMVIKCEFDDAELVECAVLAGDVVAKGDLLATYRIDYSRAEQQSLEAELTIARNSAASRKRSAADAKKEAKAALDSYAGDDLRARKRLELALERAEINERITARSADAGVAAAQKALDEFNSKISDCQVFAPKDGYVSSVEFHREGAKVARGSRVCTLITFDDISLTGRCEIADAVRYGSPVTLQAWMLGVEEYESRVVSAPHLSGKPNGDFYVEIPEGEIETMIKGASGNLRNSGAELMRRSMGIRIVTDRYRVDNVVLVPNDAVKNEDTKRFVYVMRDGELKKRYIATGLSDDQNTQVLDGLVPGERVQVG